MFRGQHMSTMDNMINSILDNNNTNKNKIQPTIEQIEGINKIIFKKERAAQIERELADEENIKWQLEIEAKRAKEHKTLINESSLGQLASKMNRLKYDSDWEEYTRTSPRIQPILISYKLLKEKVTTIQKSLDTEDIRELKIRADLLEYIKNNDYKHSDDDECYIFNKRGLMLGELRDNKFYIRFTGRKFKYSECSYISFKTEHIATKEQIDCIKKHLSFSCADY